MSADITPSNNEEVVSASPNPTPPHKNLFADCMRTIGAIDPFLREMHIGLGCALENLLMAAAANGYTTQVSLLPDALDETWVACVDLAPGPTVIPDLYPLIPNRHTNRYPDDIGRSVTSATLDALSALNDDPEVRVFWFASAPLRKQVGDLLVEATHVSVSDTTQIGESDGWYRATWQDLQQYRDGITIDAAGLPDWKRTLGKMLPPNRRSSRIRPSCRTLSIRHRQLEPLA